MKKPLPKKWCNGRMMIRDRKSQATECSVSNSLVDKVVRIERDGLQGPWKEDTAPVPSLIQYCPF